VSPNRPPLRSGTLERASKASGLLRADVDVGIKDSLTPPRVPRTTTEAQRQENVDAFKSIRAHHPHLRSSDVVK
jgi:hypothetical protein